MLKLARMSQPIADLRHAIKKGYRINVVIFMDFFRKKNKKLDFYLETINVAQKSSSTVTQIAYEPHRLIAV